MKSLEQEVTEALSRTVPRIALDTAVKDVMAIIQERVGKTQEKLFNDLQNERALRQAGERRENALRETLVTIQTERTNDEPSAE